MDIKPSTLSDLKTSGFIATVNQYGEDYRLLDLKTGELSPIEGEKNDFVIRVSVSPGGKEFAYLLDSRGNSPRVDELVVSTLVRQKTIIPWQDGWIKWDWLDDGRIIIGKADNRFGSYIVVTSHSGQIENIPLDSIKANSVFPTVYHYINAENQQIETSFAELFFDPTLTRVVHFGGYHKWATVLTDLNSGNDLADLPNILTIPDFSPSRISYPVWAPDGKSFLIEASNNDEARELYRVSREGEITRLTYLTNNHQRVRIQDYSFSPDQHYIAFWLLTDQYKEYHLAVFDTTTNEITDTCILAYINNSEYVPLTPFWAQNSNQFVIETNPTEEGPLTVIVDLQKNTATKIAEDRIPEGWLVSP